MSLAGFTHIGTYTLPTLAGTHTNFPVLLRYADFDAAVISQIKSDGSDLRLSLNDDTQIALHVVRWNPASNDILVHTNLPSASTGTVIKLWGNNSGASMLPETDTYGQYEAYKWFVWYAHDGRTNVANTGTLTYTGAEPDGTSPFSGISTGYDGVDDSSGSGVGYDLDIKQTFVAMAKVDAFPTSGYGAIIGIVQSTDNDRHAMLAVDSSQRARANKDRYTSDGAQGATTLSTGTWYHMGATFGEWGTVDHKVYLNGSLDGTSNQNNQTRYVNVNLFRIGSRDALDPFNGEIAHAGMRQYREESADWMADHASNLQAVGAWGTMTSEGGGGTTTISVNGISNSNSIDITTLVQQSILSVNSLSENNLLDSATLSSQSNVTTQNIDNGQNLDNTSLVQDSNLPLQDLDNNQGLTGTDLTQNNILVSQELSNNTLLDNTVLIQQNLLSSDHLDSDQVVDSPALTQEGSLNTQEIINTNILDNITLTQLNNLAVDSLLSGNKIDNTILSQLGQLSVLSLTNNNTLDSITLTQATAINVQSISQNMTLEQCALSVLGILSVESLYHLSSTDVINLTQQSTLTLDDVNSPNVLENIELIQNYLLSVESLSNNNLLDNLIIQQKDNLVLQNISSGTTLENTNLLQNLTLVVDPITNQQSLGVVFFGILPELESFLLTFEKDDVSGAFDINIINITFGE